MKVLGVIPARYASTRFPGKSLADIHGKPMIQLVYEQAKKTSSLDKVVVATDDERIASCVNSFGGEVCMTSENHPNGTTRCREVLEKQDEAFDFVVNIQGDEPFIDPITIDDLVNSLSEDSELGTMIKEINDVQVLDDPNVVKAIINSRHEAIYFSRNCIPYLRGIAPHERMDHHKFYKHIGLYAYRSDILKIITELPVGKLEMAESLEQLRWIENGLKIKTAVTAYESIGIDTPEDLEKVLSDSNE